jgi:hypothetical protein
MVYAQASTQLNEVDVSRATAAALNRSQPKPATAKVAGAQVHAAQMPTVAGLVREAAASAEAEPHGRKRKSSEEVGGSEAKRSRGDGGQGTGEMQRLERVPVEVEGVVSPCQLVIDLSLSPEEARLPEWPGKHEGDLGVRR